MPVLGVIFLRHALGDDEGNGDGTEIVAPIEEGRPLGHIRGIALPRTDASPTDLHHTRCTPHPGTSHPELLIRSQGLANLRPAMTASSPHP